MNWNDPALRSEVIELARVSRNRTDLRRRLAQKLGHAYEVTSDMLRSAWKRWENNGVAPPIDDVVGSGLSDDQDEPENDLEETGTRQRIKFPPNTRMPDPCPDHIIQSKRPLPRSLISDGDMHYPYHDPYVENAKLKFAQTVGVDVWVNIGDAYDFWMLSTFEKTEADRVFDGSARLQTEFDAAKPYWQEVCRITKQDVHFIVGNHEHRLLRFIGANVWAYGLDAFEWHTLAGLPKKVQVHDYAAQVRIGPINFEHGDRICPNAHSTHPASLALQHRPQRNTIFGHSHKLSTKVQAYYDGISATNDAHIAINQGHGCDTKLQVYAGPEPNWMHAFTFIEFYTEAGRPRFTAHPIPILNGQFVFDGRVYDGRKL